MACRGVHFSLTIDEESSLLAADGDEQVMAFVEKIEERWDATHLAESDKAWDAMHRCLSDGTLDPQGGSAPLNLVVLGGRWLHEADDYIVCFVSKDQVKAAAAALEGITQDWLRQRYFALNPDEYDAEIGEEDFLYTWENFQDVRTLFRNASAENRSVIFTADQ